MLICAKTILTSFFRAILVELLQRSVIKMKGIILFSVGLMMLLLALSCDAAPKDQRSLSSRSMSPIRRGTYCRQRTTSGDCCSIPFTYLAVKYYSCTKFAHTKPWCALDRYYQSGRWGECKCVQKTKRGGCCKFPFKYKSKIYYSCTKDDYHEPWCSFNYLYIVGQWGVCDCINGGHRIRKEFISMTTEEKTRYIQAVKTATTDSRYKPEMEKLLTTHRTLFQTDIHQKKFFLPWHRWFTLQYENILRKVDCSVTVPYWDWSSSNAFDTSSNGVWNSLDSGFGGNGTGASQCVPTGPFRDGEWSIVPPHNDPETPNNCLAREFGSLPTKDDVKDLLSKPASDFTDFEMTLRAVLHFNVHQGVGGTMFTFNSASAPEFFLVHSFVDKIWDDWQKKSDDRRNAFFPTVTDNMPEANILPKEVIHLISQPGDVYVEYASSAAKSRRGQSLGEAPRISRELDPKIIKLFNVSSAEVEKINKKKQLVQPRKSGEVPRISRELSQKVIEMFQVKPEEVEKINKKKQLVQPRESAYKYG